MYIEEIYIECDTSNVTDMNHMFAFCNELTELDLGSNFNTGQVTDMSWMFDYCSRLTKLDLGSKFNTENVTDMNLMFAFCNYLTELNLGDNFDTSNVTNMDWMFTSCIKIKDLDISMFNTKNVSNMEHMFTGMHSLESLNLGKNFYTNNVEDMTGMFAQLRSLEELDFGDKFDTSGLKSGKMADMFLGSNKIKYLNLWDWTIPNGENLNRFFSATNINRLRLGLGVKTIKGSELPAVLKSGGYTGGWINEDHPETIFKDSDEFMEEYNGDNPDHVGTYSREYIYYKLSYDPGEGEGPVPVGKDGAHVDEEYKILFDPKPSKKGSTFAGWKITNDDTLYTETETGKENETSNRDITLKAGNDGEDPTIKLTAQYNINHYTVEFNANASEATGTMNNQEFTYDSEQVLTPNAFERNGYTFMGWKDNSGKLYSDEDIVKNLTHVDGNTVTLYAQWEKIPPEEKETKALAIKANDLNINLNEASKLTDKEVLNKSEAKVYEETLKAGEVISSKLVKDVEIKVNADDLEKIKSTKDTGVFKVRLTAINEIGTAEKEIEVTVEDEPVKIEEKSVEIEASDFSTSIKEFEKTKSLEKLILEKSKAKAFYVEKNSLGEETKRKQIDVKINADDLDKLKAAKKAGDYRIRLSAEEEDVNNDMTITVTVKKPSEKPSKETPKDKDKERPLKDKINKKSKNNSKTGVAGIAGVAALLAVASGAYISSKRK